MDEEIVLMAMQEVLPKDTEVLEMVNKAA